MDFVLWCENMQHADKNINLQVRKEADYYGDMIILPFIDRYDIVVLKTVAICEFGVCFFLLKS